MFLSAIVARLPKEESYTIIYTTSPSLEVAEANPAHNQKLYEMDDPYPSSVHMDLKRDVESHAQDAQLDSSLPLFEKYQFLSPGKLDFSNLSANCCFNANLITTGVFMGLLVSFGLLSILYVGINAISSLEVSYFAFSKEMGPAAQKKQ